MEYCGIGDGPEFCGTGDGLKYCMVQEMVWNTVYSRISIVITDYANQVAMDERIGDYSIDSLF
jgi:hypothetical protein